MNQISKIKSIIASVLALTIALSLAACDKNTNRESYNEDETREKKLTSRENTIEPRDADSKQTPDTSENISDSKNAPDELIVTAPTVDWDKASKSPADLAPASESDFDYSYDAELGGIVINKYKGDATSVVIPATIEDEPVVKIMQFGSNKKLEYVYFPSSLIDINGSAFNDIENLTLIFPENIEIVGTSVLPTVKNFVLSDNMFRVDTLYLPLFKSLNKKTENIKYNGKTYILSGENRENEIAKLYNEITGGDYESDKIIAEDWSYGYVDYTDKGYDVQGLAVTNYSNKDGKLKVTIPSEIEGKPIIAIADYCEGFKNCIEITIPEGVKIIGNDTFRDTKNLTSIKIPDSVIFIGDSVFFYSGLTEITLPNGLKEMGAGVFGQCENLTTLNIPDSVNKINAANGGYYPIYGNLTVCVYKGKTYDYNSQGQLIDAINGTSE